MQWAVTSHALPDFQGACVRGFHAPGDAPGSGTPKRPVSASNRASSPPRIHHSASTAARGRGRWTRARRRWAPGDQAEAEAVELEEMSAATEAPRRRPARPPPAATLLVATLVAFASAESSPAPLTSLSPAPLAVAPAPPNRDRKLPK